MENELPVLNEPFLRNVSMKFREQRKPFIISLKFRAKGRHYEGGGVAG